VVIITVLHVQEEQEEQEEQEVHLYTPLTVKLLVSPARTGAATHCWPQQSSHMAQ